MPDEAAAGSVDSATPSRQSGHSASGQDGTDSDSRDREGTGKGARRQAPIHDRPDGHDAPSRCVDCGGRFARGLSRREDVLDHHDRLPRREGEAAAQREGSVLALDEHRRQAERTRRLVADDDAAERRGDDDLRRKLAEALAELSSGLLGPGRPHQQTRALEVAVGVETARETKVTGEQGPGLLEILEGSMAESLTTPADLPVLSLEIL